MNMNDSSMVLSLMAGGRPLFLSDGEWICNRQLLALGRTCGRRCADSATAAATCRTRCRHRREYTSCRPATAFITATGASLNSQHRMIRTPPSAAWGEGDMRQERRWGLRCRCQRRKQEGQFRQKMDDYAKRTDMAVKYTKHADVFSGTYIPNLHRLRYGLRGCRVVAKCRMWGPRYLISKVKMQKSS